MVGWGLAGRGGEWQAAQRRARWRAAECREKGGITTGLGQQLCSSAGVEGGASTREGGKQHACLLARHAAQGSAHWWVRQSSLRPARCTPRAPHLPRAPLAQLLSLALRACSLQRDQVGAPEPRGRGAGGHAGQVLAAAGARRAAAAGAAALEVVQGGRRQDAQAGMQRSVHSVARRSVAQQGAARRPGRGRAGCALLARRVAVEWGGGPCHGWRVMVGLAQWHSPAPGRFMAVPATPPTASHPLPMGSLSRPALHPALPRPPLRRSPSPPTPTSTAWASSRCAPRRCRTCWWTGWASGWSSACRRPTLRPALTAPCSSSASPPELVFRFVRLLPVPACSHS